MSNASNYVQDTTQTPAGLKLFSIDSQLWKEIPLPNQLTLTPLMKTRLSFLVPRTCISTHMMIFEKLFLPWTRISSEILFPKQTVAAICLSAPVTWKGTTNPRSLITSQSPIQLSAWIHNCRISNTAYPGSLVPSISCCTSPSQPVPQATKTLSISSVRYMNYSPIPLRMSPRSEWIICSSLQASAARLPVWHLPKQLLLWNPKSCWNTPTWLNLPCKSVVPITVQERRIPRVVPLPTIIKWILPQTKTTPVLLPITLFARIFAARHIRRTTILRELPSRRPSTTFPKSLGTHLQRTLGSKRNLFTSPPPMQSLPSATSSTLPNPNQISAIEKEILAMLSKKAIEEVHPNSYGFRSRLFTVPKKTGDIRPVLNLRPLNQFIPQRHFKMETLKQVCTVINQGDYLTSIDLTDAFMHVLVHQSSRRFLQFTWKG